MTAAPAQASAPAPLPSPPPFATSLAGALDAPAQPSFAASAVRLLPVQIALRIGETLFPVLLAMWFGRSAELDAFMVAWTAFTFAGAFVLDVHRDSALVPLVARLRARDPRALNAFLTGTMGHTLLVAATLATGTGIALLIVRGPGATLGVLVPLLAVQLVIASARALLVGVANASHRFVLGPALGAVATAVTLAGTACGHHRLGIPSVAASLVAGEALATAVLWRAIHHQGVRIGVGLRRTVWLRAFARESAEQVAGSALSRLSPLVDQLMAPLAAVVGGGTLLKLTSDVALAPGSILQATILPVLLTHLSDAVARGDVARTRALIRRTLIIVLIMAAVVGAALSWAARPLLTLVYRHGAMDGAGIDLMAAVLPCFACGLPGLASLLVLARAHVALGNSRALLVAGLVNCAANAGFNVLLGPRLGLAGLALSTSATSTAVAAAFGVLLARRLRRLTAKPLPS